MKKQKYVIASLIVVGVIIGLKLYIPLFNVPIDVESFSKYDVTIYRDTWGVPHVFGKKDKDTAYGLAYAHAEDDFKTIQDIMLSLRGNLAMTYGKDGAANDYMVQLL